MYDGLKDAAATFCFSDLKSSRVGIPLVGPYDRKSHFYEELGNGEGSEDERLLNLDECFTQGWLNADQVRDAMDF